MRTIRNSFSSLAIIGGLIASLNFVHAQTTARQVQSSTDSVDVLSVLDQARTLAASEPVLEQSIPVTATGPSVERPAGTYWGLANTQPPLPFDPFPDLPVYVVDPTNRIFLVDDRSVDFPGLQAQQEEQAQMRAMTMDVPSPGDGGGDGGTNNYFTSNYSPPDYGTNLWLEITNIADGAVDLLLHNSQPGVPYELLSKQTLLDSQWVSEGMVTGVDNDIVTPATVNIGERTDSLFIRALSWLDSNADGIPDWWILKYFGTLALSATNLDSQGNTLLYDYQNGLDPNIISFSLLFTNQYVHTSTPSGVITVSSGVPSYLAVLINSSDFSNATWQPYTSNVTVNLNQGDGTYEVFVGLRGLPADGWATWQEARLTLTTAPLTLALTNPVSNVVSMPMIQLQGYAGSPLSSLTFDISNRAGIWTNQTGYITGEFYDTNLMAYTTNWFQCYDVVLTNGLNIITVHATDMVGYATATNFTVTLDYSGDTNPPVLNVIWPQDGTYISGSQFTFEGQVDDTTAKITATIVDANGDTNTVQGLVERNGTVWAQNLPLATGANTLTITAMDVAGNASTTHLTLFQSSVTVTMNPLTSDQLNQPSVTVYGTVSDATAQVYVNDVQATVNEDGTWETDNVPVNPTGTAIFNVKIYLSGSFGMRINRPNLVHANDAPSGTDVGSQQFTQPQPITVNLVGYSRHTYFHHIGISSPWLGVNLWEDGVVNWTSSQGGTAFSTGVSTGEYGPISYSDEYDLSTNLPNGYFEPWQYASFDTDTLNNHTQTKVAIVPQGQAAVGTAALYLVRVVAQEFSDPWGSLPGYLAGDLPLPPEWLQINGQTLVNSGITNDDDSVWGETIVAAPAGKNVDIAPVATRVYQYQAFSFDVQAYELGQLLAVDNNRDGQITFDAADATTQVNPYRFWINDSKESGDDESSGGAADQIPGQSFLTANYPLIHVNGRSDLVNFFPVALCLSNVLQWLPPTNGWEYHLTQNDAGLPAGMGNGAVKFVYTSLSPTNAFDYLTNTAGFGYGTNSDEWATNADTIQVLNTPGTVLDTNWLAQVQANGGYGVILMEGCAATTQPLMLEIWHNGQKMGGVSLYLSITGVEQMFRHLNFSYVNSSVTVPARADAPNEPQTNGKNLVFLHGYNVNQQEARGVESEMFKRFYWSGSKAKFYGVTWNGAESKGTFPFYNIFTPNYHTNVVNALQTASSFANYLGTLSGQTVVAAHSLGNMVVLSAISDYNAQPSKYFMIDAAVPMEAIQGDMSYNPNVLYSTWNPYANRTFASDWWQLFTNDYRSTLTWSNRLGNLGTVDIYNFYSSGEEVLREYDSDPPSTVLSGSETELKLHLWDDLPYGIYAWVWQEKGKGTCQQDWFLGSSHGGWRFPVNEYGDPNLVPPFTANSLPDSTLRQTPIFDFGSYFDSVSGPFPDLTLTNTDGSASTYAQANRDRILSDAIPALTLPVGANSVTRLDERAGGTRNFNMQTKFVTGWPAARTTGDEAYKWYHSDFDYVAYPFTHKLFDEIVSDGSLK